VVPFLTSSGIRQLQFFAQLIHIALVHPAHPVLYGCLHLFAQIYSVALLHLILHSSGLLAAAELPALGQMMVMAGADGLIRSLQNFLLIFVKNGRDEQQSQPTSIPHMMANFQSSDRVGNQPQSAGTRQNIRCNASTSGVFGSHQESAHIRKQKRVSWAKSGVCHESGPSVKTNRLGLHFPDLLRRKSPNGY